MHADVVELLLLLLLLLLIQCGSLAQSRAQSSLTLEIWPLTTG